MSLRPRKPGRSSQKAAEEPSATAPPETNSTGTTPATGKSSSLSPPQKLDKRRGRKGSRTNWWAQKPPEPPAQDWPKLSPEYLAGYIDGEGTITLKPAPSDLTRGGKPYQPFLCLTSIDAPILYTLKQHYGGSITRCAARAQSARPYYVYDAQGAALRAILSDVSHHLILKAPQASQILQLLALYDTYPPSQRGEIFQAASRTIYSTVRALNQRGSQHGK